MPTVVYQLNVRKCSDEQRWDAMSGFRHQQHVRHCAALWALGMYDRVATVATDHLGVEPGAECPYEDQLNDAYRRTNTVEAPWYDESVRIGVQLDYSGNGCRSTSVGDVLVVGGEPNSRDVRLYVVSSFGFTEFTEMLRTPEPSL